MKTPILNFNPMDRYQEFIDAELQEGDTGHNCPNCGYPIVIESGLEVCYRCGWSEEDKYEGYYDE